MSVKNEFALVSIVIPAYNHENYVQKTIESLISQDYQNLELIILNDGSSDNTGQRIKDILPASLQRFHRIEFVDKENEGLSKTLNQGIRLAKGKYIFHLASDDLVDPNTISALLALIETDEKIAVVCGDADFINEQGESTSRESNGIKFTSFIKSHTIGRQGFSLAKDFGTYKSLLTGNYIPIGILVRSSVYNEVGYYMEDLMLEDWDFWLRVAKKYRILLLNKVTAHYRIHSLNTVTTHHKRLVIDSIAILAREYTYCIKLGLIDEWRSIMFSYLKETTHLDDVYNPKILLNVLSAELLYYIESCSNINFLTQNINSWSWKITKPLCWLSRIFTHFKK